VLASVKRTATPPNVRRPLILLRLLQLPHDGVEEGAAFVCEVVFLLPQVHRVIPRSHKTKALFHVSIAFTNIEQIV
jgi:hypothetical protein